MTRVQQLIDLPDIAEHLGEWKPWDDEGCGLLSTVKLFGQLFHVQAIRIHCDSHGWEIADNLDFETALNGMHLIDDGGHFGHFQTVHIPGHEGEWVIAITPFSS